MNRFLVHVKKARYAYLTSGLLIFSTLLDPNFMNPFNIESLLIDIAIIGIMTLGQAIVIFNGGIDLSVGNIASMTTVLMAWMMVNIGHSVTGIGNILICILFVLAAGACIGFLTGISVAKFHLPPIIASLGTMWIARGFAFFFLRGMATAYPEKGFLAVARSTIGPVPYAFLFFLVLTFLLYIVLTRTQFGRSVYAVGGNEYAAHISGINTIKVRTIIYVASGVLAALAGIILGAYQGTSYPKAASGYELFTIAGVVMGGTSLKGGEGSLWNCVLGLAMFRIINKIMIFANLSGYFEGIYIGSIILIALYFSSRDSKRIEFRNGKNSKMILSKAGE